MKRLFRASVLGSALVLGTASVASACPMCKIANEQDENRPRAYMYSILFMMSMPAVIGTVFGIGLYRLHRKGQAMASSTAPDPRFSYPLATDQPAAEG